MLAGVVFIDTCVFSLCRTADGKTATNHDRVDEESMNWSKTCFFFHWCVTVWRYQDRIPGRQPHGVTTYLFGKKGYTLTASFLRWSSCGNSHYSATVPTSRYNFMVTGLVFFAHSAVKQGYCNRGHSQRAAAKYSPTYDH